MKRCAECNGPMEISPYWPDAGYLHSNDSDDTHTPVLTEDTP